MAGDQVDCETMFAARELAGSAMLEGRQTGLAYDTSSPKRSEFQHDDMRASKMPM